MGTNKPVRYNRRRDRIDELRHQGWTCNAIATELDMNPGTISVILSRLRHNGTHVPPPGRKPTPKPEAPQPRSPTVEPGPVNRCEWAWEYPAA